MTPSLLRLIVFSPWIHPPLGNAAKVISEPGTGRSRGFGAVMYYNESDALAAYKGMHGVELEGRFLYVDRYRDGQERDRAAYRAAGYDRPYEGSSRRGPADSAAAPYGTATQTLTARILVANARSGPSFACATRSHLRASSKGRDGYERDYESRGGYDRGGYDR
jgi:RNA recognition motif-containing protein